MKEHLTSENFPIFLCDKILGDREYEYVETELIPGKSIVINKAGMLWLYMSDDNRREEPIQIIVKRIGNPDLAFLDIDSKRAIRLTNYKYV